MGRGEGFEEEVGRGGWWDRKKKIRRGSVFDSVLGRRVVLNGLMLSGGWLSWVLRIGLVRWRFVGDIYRIVLMEGWGWKFDWGGLWENGRGGGGGRVCE